MAYIGQSPKLKRVRYTPQTTIPSNASEGDVFYSDGTASAEGLYVYTNGAWEPVGSSGAGGINYIENNDAESATTGWATYDDGASATPVDGTGGSATAITFSRNTTTPLRGVADFDIAKSAADGQGEGVSYDFTVDSADQYSILRISFDYSTSANYVDGDIAAFIYDVGNSQLIRLSKEDVDATNLTGHFVSEFQSTDSSNYRLVLHVTSTNASAYDFNFDNVVVGPREITRGPVVTDFTAYTPTFQGFGTPSGVNFKYRRVGDSVEIQGSFASGTVSAVEAQISLPNSWSIDSVKLNTKKIVGYYIRDHANTSIIENVVLGTGGDTFVNFGRKTASDSGYDERLGTEVSATGESATFFCTIPINGLSSNMAVSSDFGSREVLVTGQGNNAAAITSGTTINFTEITDTTGSFSGLTTFTAPDTGTYYVEGSVLETGTTTCDILIYVNGSPSRFAGDAASSSRHPFNATLSLTKGDTLTIRPTATISLSNDSVYHWLVISKHATPQTLIGSEVVVSRASGDPASAAAGAPVIFPTSDFDTFGSYNVTTGLYTVPVSGFYRVSGYVTSANATITLNVAKNGTTDASAGITDSNGEGNFYALIQASVGDTLALEPSGTLDVASGNISFEKVN